MWAQLLENIKITTNCWTIDQKMLEPTRKDILHPETEKKPTWDGRRDAIKIKSNSKSSLSVTHKLENNYITVVLPLEWSSSPYQVPQPGVWQWEERAPKEFEFESQVGFDWEFHRTGNREISLLEGTHKGKKQYPRKSLGHTYLLVFMDLSRGDRGWQWLTAGINMLAVEFWGLHIGVSPLGGCHFLIRPDLTQ